MKRKHRRVRSSWTDCGCPPGSRKVSTCSPKSGVCRGRGWGCLGWGKTKKGKSIPRWLPASCSTAAPPPPSSRKRKVVQELPAATPSAPPRRKRKVVQELPNGRAKGHSPAEFDPLQLHAGQSVEMEHTRSPDLARQIAMDHLTEDPQYYTKLLRAGL